MGKSLRDFRRDAAMDSEWVDECRAALAMELRSATPNRQRIAELETRLRRAESAASWSDFEAHRFDDEREANDGKRIDGQQRTRNHERA